jgi:hypothetical protein
MIGTSKVRSRAVVAAAGVAALLVLSACGTQKAGSAALVDGQRLTQAEVADQVQEMDDLYSSNPDAQRLTNDQLTQASISWWLNDRVIEAYAEANDIVVTDAQVDQVLGPEDQRDQLSLSTGVPPSQLEAAARAVVAYQAARQSFVQDGQTKDEALASLADELTQTAEDIGVKVNPRFGSGWAPGLTQLLLPRDPERLSSPAAPIATPTPVPSLEP